MKARLPFLTLALVGVTIAIHFLPDAGAWLEFDRDAIARGELWRWLTGHLTHFEANHLAWDVGALLALGFAAERESARRFGRTMFWSAIAISAAVWFFQPQFATYRGLSGVDSALFALVAGSFLRRGNAAATAAGVTALVAIAGKTIAEILTGSTVFAAGANYAPVPLAHLVGLLVGLGVALLDVEPVPEAPRGRVDAGAAPRTTQ